jgi:prolycopene isomerase
MAGRTASPSGFNVYLGLDCEPEELGITVSTNFILPDEDLSDKHFNQMHQLSTEDNLVAFSCYDVADPDFSPPGACQVALVTLKYIEPWLQIPPHEYAEYKYRCADHMIDRMELLCPDVRRHIEEVEVGTPLTFMRYLGAPRGAIYGFDQYNKDSLFFEPSRVSPIEGLYTAGAWVADCGFEPTLKSGASAAGAILRKLRA